MARIAVPPQHGAWAFLAIPLLIGFLRSGVSPLSVAFAVAWVAAYPASYYATQGIAARLRRRSWSVRARAEVRRAIPWAVIAALFAVIVLAARPALVVPGLALGITWLLSTWLTSRGRERGIANDLLLVLMAASATPLMAWIADPGALTASTWQIAFVLFVVFTGSVLHVKSLIREAGDRRWHAASVTWHAAALLLAFLSPWLLLAFVPALARTVVMRPGLRPSRIGAVEIAVSVGVVVAIMLAFPG